MSNSNVSIANIALTYLSSSRIIDLSQNDENARKINAIFSPTRESMLSEHNWNFARTQATLSLLSDAPTVEDYAYAYQIPTDCLRVMRLDEDSDFIVVSDKIYSNASPCVIEYIKNETNPARFSPGFVRALAYRLAADIAYGVTQNATLATAMEAKAVTALKEAKWSDGQEGSGTRIITSSLITVRQE